MNSNPKLLVIDFAWPGPWGDEMATAFSELAADIANEPGLVWKLWTENRLGGRAGGAYLFRDDISREAYFTKHSTRLAGFGITDLSVLRFDVNPGLSAITHATL